MWTTTALPINIQKMFATTIDTLLCMTSDLCFKLLAKNGSHRHCFHWRNNKIHQTKSASVLFKNKKNEGTSSIRFSDAKFSAVCFFNRLCQQKNVVVYSQTIPVKSDKRAVEWKMLSNKSLNLLSHSLFSFPLWFFLCTMYTHLSIWS